MVWTLTHCVAMLFFSRRDIEILVRLDSSILHMCIEVLGRVDSGILHLFIEVLVRVDSGILHLAII